MKNSNNKNLPQTLFLFSTEAVSGTVLKNYKILKSIIKYVCRR